MDKINYDNFNKFLVSMGIIFIILPFSGFVFICSDSFDLLIPKDELLTYTETAQMVIALKQSIPLFMKHKLVWIVAIFIVLIGLLMLGIGLVGWHGQQKKEDTLKDLEVRQKKAEIEKITDTMSDEQIIENMVKNSAVVSDSSELYGEINNIVKYMMIEYRFFNYIKSNKFDYIVKRNVVMEKCEFDVVAFAKSSFAKDYIYEVKYIYHNITISKINEYRNRMKEQKKIFSEQTNHLPYAVLVLIVIDDLYEDVKNKTKKLEKWNNYAIHIVRESELSDY